LWHRRGCGGGCAATHVALNLEEEVPPAGEQHLEEPILGVRTLHLGVTMLHHHHHHFYLR